MNEWMMERIMEPLNYNWEEEFSLRDFPGGQVVKNSPPIAGDVGSIPGWGTEIPHAVWELSLWASAREAACCNYGGCVLWSPSTTTGGKPESMTWCSHK